MSIHLRNILAAALIPMLTACGGGGSGAPAETALSGVVAKGPAEGAKVKIYAVANGVKGSLLAQATTGVGGKYEVKFPQQSGPVLIEADLKDAIIAKEGSNETFTGAAGDVMKAAFVPGTSATQTANVTPFSHMAVVAVKDLSAKEVSAANATVRQILDNKDFLTVSPTASSGDTLLPQLTLLAQRSVDDSGKSQISTLLGQLETAVEKNSDGAYAPSANYATALCGTSSDCTTGSNSVFADKTALVPVSSSANLAAVEAGKALFKDLYDTFTSIKTTGDLQTAADGLTAASANAVGFIDDDQMQLIAASVNGVSLLQSYKAGSSITSTGNGYYYYGWACYVGIATGIPSDGIWVDATKLSTAPGDFTKDTANAVVCNGTQYYYGGTITRNTTGGKYVYPSVYNQLVLLPQAGDQVKYVSRVRVAGTFTDATTGPATGTDSFTMGGVTSYQYGSAQVSVNAEKTSGTASLVGKLAPSALRALTPELKSGWEKYAYHDINLSGTASGTSVDGALQSASVDLKGAIKLIKYTDDTHTSTSEASSLNIVSGTVGTSGLNINVNVQVPGMKAEGIVTGTIVDKFPTALTFTGAIYEADTASTLRKLLEGKVEGTALSQAGGTVKFTGSLLLKNRQPMTVTLSGTKTNDVLSSKQATFAWSGHSFTITEVVSDGVVTGRKVASSNGVTFVVPTAGIGASGVDITVGTDKIGTLYENGRVNFADGTYLAI